MPTWTTLAACRLWSPPGALCCVFHKHSANSKEVFLQFCCRVAGSPAPEEFLRRPARVSSATSPQLAYPSRIVVNARRLLWRRGMLGLPPPTVVLPAATLDGTQAMLRAFTALDGNPMACELVPLELGGEFAQLPGLVVRPFATFHPVPSQVRPNKLRCSRRAAHLHWSRLSVSCAALCTGPCVLLRRC